MGTGPNVTISDPHGAKIENLEKAARGVHQVVLIFIRLATPTISQERVAMRVMQGGHDVSDEKLMARFDRTLMNLERAIRSLPLVIVFDNSDLANPYRLEAVYRDRVKI